MEGVSTISALYPPDGGKSSTYRYHPTQPEKFLFPTFSFVNVKKERKKARDPLREWLFIAPRT